MLIRTFLGYYWIFSGFWWSSHINQTNFGTYDKTHAHFWSWSSGMLKFSFIIIVHTSKAWCMPWLSLSFWILLKCHFLLKCIY